jgi:P-type E1-E2 ATPase
LPKNIWQQLQKFANVYFIIIIWLQCIPEVSNTGGRPANLWPLIIIVLTSMVKDGKEDYQMHKNDAEENEEETEVFNRATKTWFNKKWEDVAIGDLIRITDTKDKNKIPADLLLLYAKNNDGTCLIETKNLDGETNQKIRSAHLDM